MWKAQKARFPHSHNHYCYCRFFSFLKHNFSFTPPADGGSGFGRPEEPLLHFGFARGDAQRRAAADEGSRSRRVLPGPSAGAGGDGSGDALALVKKVVLEGFMPLPRNGIETWH